ncbi:hypothetical protein E3P94_00958 [Wallemia ichthyophaga]|nr:hypothetical protein E3P95_00826 [Wallemia ichthyophaga]TIB03567.1 hypothetical protein E3P94_00958 [Wallemia ichthyophaga]TIB06731.1 hypothetical protein E3P96_00183 [Wallemia ichthyophaga]
MDFIKSSQSILDEKRDLYFDSILKHNDSQDTQDTSTDTSTTPSLPSNPLHYDSELSQSIDFFGKLKFKFVEQQTKENFLKSILSSQPPLITPEDNSTLEDSNKNDKLSLKQAKQEADDKTIKLNQLVDFVDNQHSLYTQDISTTTTLLNDIQQIQLELAKLRATHPPEQRLTPSVAQEILDDQIIEMQNLSDIKQNQSIERSNLTQQIKSLSTQDERLQSDLSAAKRMGIDAKRAKEHVQDGIEDLNSWLDTATKVYSSLIGILDVHTPEPATLQIDYDARKNLDGKFNPETHPKCTLKLHFNPQSRRFISAQLINPPPSINLDDVIQAAELHASPPRLIQHLLHRLRTQ